MVMRTFYESQGKPVYLIRAVRNVGKVAVTPDDADAGQPVEKVVGAA
jgi:hypothetical protein